MTEVNITVRVIRSFEYRSIRPIVVKNIDTKQSVLQFKHHILESIRTKNDFPPPVRNYEYDTLKIEHQAHAAKSYDLVINTENDDAYILKDDDTLESSGVCNETELSFFKLTDYLKYKNNPSHAW